MTKRPGEWDALQSTPTAMELATMENFVKSGYDLSKLKECAIQAGSPSSVASRVATSTLGKMGNNPMVQKALKKAKVDVNRLATKLAELLDCEHPAHEGKPDNAIQYKAVEMGFKLHDAFPNPKLQIDENKTETIRVEISAELVNRLEKVTGQKVIDIEPIDPTKGYFPEGS